MYGGVLLNLVGSLAPQGGVGSFLRRSLESKKALLDMRKGNYDGKAVVFRRLFDTAATLAERVSCAYRLAGISRYFGNGDEEKDWLTFAVDRKSVV